MTIAIENEAAELLAALKGKQSIVEAAAANDYGIDAETYVALGLKYYHTNDKHLKQRILDYLTEINYHTSREALENSKTDLFEYVKAY